MIFWTKLEISPTFNLVELLEFTCLMDLLLWVKLIFFACIKGQLYCNKFVMQQMSMYYGCIVLIIPANVMQISLVDGQHFELAETAITATKQRKCQVKYVACDRYVYVESHNRVIA